MEDKIARLEMKQSHSTCSTVLSYCLNNHPNMQGYPGRFNCIEEYSKCMNTIYNTVRRRTTCDQPLIEGKKL